VTERDWEQEEAMPRKTFEQKVEEAKEKYIKSVLAHEVNAGDAATYQLYEDRLREALRALRLREKDVTYHMRDASARVEGVRSRRRRDQG
jgi:hypothetical protein